MNTTATNVYPCRLVMIQIQNNCMFCEKPQGQSFTQYVHLATRMGYIYCDKCKTAADEACAYWRDCVAYGKANYLKDRDIQVKRSSGIIEHGWELYNPFIHTNDEGIDKIHCYNKAQDLGRWCKLEDILELNSRFSDL